MLINIYSIPVKPIAPDANGKVADDVTVEKVKDKVTTNGETKAVEETNGSATKEGEKEEDEEEYYMVRWVISMNTRVPNRLLHY